MTLFVFSLVFVAASLHVVWNTVVKACDDKASFAWLTLVVQAVLLAPVFVAFRLARPGPINAELWGWSALSGLLEGLYFILLFGAYRRTDMSVAYPLSRGIAPIVTMAIASVFLGAAVTPFRAVAVLGITLGVVGVSISTREARMQARHLRGILLAILTGCTIAGYHMVDSRVMKLTTRPNPLEYLFMIHVFLAIYMTVWMCLSRRRRKSAFSEWTSNRRGVLIVSVLLPLAYLMILLALRHGNVTYVTAGRNVGILISAGVSAALLKEKVTRLRLAGVLLIAVGVAALILLGGD